MNGSLKVFLVVEDDLNDFYFIERELKSLPARIVHVRDGVEAMEYLQGQRKFADRKQYPLPHLILVDLKMPRMNGFEFLEWLKRSAGDGLPALPVIVSSSSNAQEDINRAYALGACGYMVKPIPVAEFCNRLKALGLLWTEHLETPQVEEKA